MNTARRGRSKPKIAVLVAPAKAALPVRTAFGCALIAAAVLPAVLTGEASGGHVNSTPSTGITAAADTSPACPDAYLCLQSGPDPLVPYGTDPGVPYGTNTWNSRVPFGRGSGDYTGGAF